MLHFNALVTIRHSVGRKEVLRPYLLVLNSGRRIFRPHGNLCYSISPVYKVLLLCGLLSLFMLHFINGII